VKGKSISNIFSNIILGSITFLFFVALIYTWFMSSELIKSGTLVWYATVFIVGFLLYSFSLFTRISYRLNFSLASVSVIVAIFIVEIYLMVTGQRSAFANYPPRLQDVYKELNIFFDSRSKYEVLSDMKNNGIHAISNIFSANIFGTKGITSNSGTQLFPLAGVSNTNVVFCNESGSWVVIENDEHGFNNPKGLYRKGSVEMALVGDSFTHGKCVDYTDNVAGQLRKLGHNVLSIGMSSSGPLLYLARIKEYLTVLHPRIVLWFHSESNDLIDLRSERRQPMLMRYLNEEFTQNLFERQGEIDVTLTGYFEERFENYSSQQRSRKRKPPTLTTRLFRCLRLWHLRVRLGRNHTFQKSLFVKVLQEAKKTISSFGGKLYFVYLPDYQRYYDRRTVAAYKRNQVIAAVKSCDIPLIDFHQVLKNHPDPLSMFPHRLFGHYNTYGYKKLAEQIDNHFR
jgi:hypothetical protein